MSDYEKPDTDKPAVAPRPRRDPMDRDPVAPPRDLVDMVGGRILDPSSAMKIKGVTPRATVYVSDRLLAPTSRLESIKKVLDQAGAGKGWHVVDDPDFQAWELTIPDPRNPQNEITLGRTRLLIEVTEGGAAFDECGRVDAVGFRI